MVNEKGKILKKKVNINRLKSFKHRLPTQLPEQTKAEEPNESNRDYESEEKTTAIRINHPQFNVILILKLSPQR